ncbi:MAG: cysteine-rich CWC family protein [Spirochaetes bacterium]|nr:cysteine-rich CWC family protein [Spirochaetota bacterium]
MTRKATVQKHCPKCGAPFTCGHAAGDCWCAGPEFKVVSKIPESYRDCLCPACLKAYCMDEGAARPERTGESTPVFPRPPRPSTPE